MTHGYIYIPFRRNPNQLLFCEAWSDGHIDYVGLGALNSSGHIHEVAELSELFVGSPFFYYPDKKEFFAKEQDYLIDGFSEGIGYPFSFESSQPIVEINQETEDDYKAIVDSARETLDLVLEGNIKEAFQTRFGQMTFEDKRALYLGINVEVVDSETEWKKFVKEAIVLEQDELFDFLIEQLKKIDDPTDENLEDLDAEALHEYVWKDNQFWSALYIEQKEYISPLIINCALFCDTDQGYIQHITPTDKATLDAFKAKLIENNMSLSLLFKGNVTV